MKICHICGALLSDHKCQSCEHEECSECEVYVPRKSYDQLEAEVASLTQDKAKLRAALALLLDNIDYEIGNCRPNEMVAAVLPREVLSIAKKAR
jgi:hypothetical protein